MTEAEFVGIRKVRMLLRDPAAVNDLIFADSVPCQPDAQAGYYIADLGNYQRFNERKDAWERLPTSLSDAVIAETLKDKGPVFGPIALIDFIIMGLQTGATSFKAGAESVSMPSPADMLAFYREKKNILIEQAGLNTGRAIRTPRPVIGGVSERW